MHMPNEILRGITSHKPSNPVLSLYVDMSVNSDNKRTYQTFINKQRSRLAELESDRDAKHREALGEAIHRAEEWLAKEFDTQCKGAAIFTELGGDWFHAVAYPRALPNRMEIGPEAVVSTLRAALANERRYCIGTIDREHLHLISLYLGKVEEDRMFAPAIEQPSKHDVQAGGFAQKDMQKWKAEETRKHFKEFADEVEKMGTSCRADGYVLLGTDENVKHFLEFLPQQIRDRVVHTAHAPSGGATSDIVRTVEPALADVTARETARAIDELLSRVRTEHLVTAGWQDTLKELQEGKVDTLFIASNESKEGVQCTQCGFYLVRRDGSCPYCGGDLKDGVDLVESMVRMAAGQEVRLEFVAGDVMNGVSGVGALLKFR
jgi:peptide subunit release factor 1 (eRF1)